MARKLKIRDFIYLDVERMKSIIAQIDEGIVESSTKEKNIHKAVSGKGQGSGGISGLAKLKGEIGGEIFWENKETETKTLHDYMYNVLEKVLKDQELIYIISEDDVKIKKAWKGGTFSKEISDNSFVLIKGKVMIDDYNQFGMIANNASELGELFGEGQDPFFNDEKMDGILTLIKVFYQNELFVKVLPFSDNPYLRFIGNLKRESLRDSIESITFKYSTNPVSDWYFFGQISSIFPKDYNPQKSIMETKYGKIIQEAGNINTILNNLAREGFNINSNYDLDQINISELLNISPQQIEFLKSFHLDKLDYAVLKNVGFDTVFESVFNAFRMVDYALSTKFPSITFTPIAVYRGD
jgi:hypothetical protein